MDKDLDFYLVKMFHFHPLDLIQVIVLCLQIEDVDVRDNLPVVEHVVNGAKDVEVLQVELELVHRIGEMEHLDVDVEGVEAQWDNQYFVLFRCNSLVVLHPTLVL